jgi:hypothetical protein
MKTNLFDFQNAKIMVNLVATLLGLGDDLLLMAAEKPQPRSAIFPRIVMRGILGELARELAKGTEVPEEFIYAAAITCLGSIVSGQVEMNLGLDSDTRLYTVLLGSSYEVRKSTAMRKTLEFFQSLRCPWSWNVSHGVASAEGLMDTLQDSKLTLLTYDELRAFFDKSQIQASTLLPMVTSLFENHNWDNRSKNRAASVRDARLSLLGCCTTDTYEKVFSSEAIAIGLPNRLFIVSADARPRIAWPEKPNEANIAALRRSLQTLLAKLPVRYEATDDAKAEWEAWYKNLPSSEYTRRLDTIGFRLMPLLALSSCKETVDLEVVRNVIAILDYELSVRAVYDPIDADNAIAKMEINIRRQLQRRGALRDRELRKYTNAHRSGDWCFRTALKNLQGAGEVYSAEKVWRIKEDLEET